MIRIALVDHVSVGKTTLLNALLQDKVTEVSSLRRTTAAVNYFCLSQGATTSANARDMLSNDGIRMGTKEVVQGQAFSNQKINPGINADSTNRSQQPLLHNKERPIIR